MKKISILGSTGSIGIQTLDIVRNNKNFQIVGLSANENIEILEKQALEFKPKLVSVGNIEKSKILKNKLAPYGIKVECGLNGLVEVATLEEADIILNSVVGMIGLVPTIEAIKHEKIIALANKETLVAGGEIVMRELQQRKGTMIPVDSEHSAIFQCLKSGEASEVEKIILTASGGPFRGKSKSELEKVNVKDALNHPNWSMGKKISVDSASLMNKGLEIIEARWLFDIDLDKINVLVHPQSIIHSMVEFVDGSVIAQLGTPDMRTPIQYALTYPDRIRNDIEKLDLLKYNKLTFEEPDYETFPCLNLAIKSIKKGGTLPTVLNASNEVAVELFLNEKIRFLDIPYIIEEVMSYHKNILNPKLEDILSSDNWAREMTLRYLKGGKNN